MNAKPEIALSVRQPYADPILRGTKKIEFRSVPTARQPQPAWFRSFGLTQRL